MLFVCYPGCSTCAKARKYLDAVGADYRERDIKSENPTARELSRWIEKSGLPAEKFFNTSGVSYRKLSLKDRLGSMSAEKKISLLASDGMLVKRPVLVGDDFLLVGFREKEWDKIFKNNP